MHEEERPEGNDQETSVEELAPIRRLQHQLRAAMTAAIGSKMDSIE
jgi:hypothetical protein